MRKTRAVLWAVIGLFAGCCLAAGISGPEAGGITFTGVLVTLAAATGGALYGYFAKPWIQTKSKQRKADDVLFDAFWRGDRVSQGILFGEAVKSGGADAIEDAAMSLAEKLSMIIRSPTVTNPYEAAAEGRDRIDELLKTKGKSIDEHPGVFKLIAEGILRNHLERGVLPPANEHRRWLFSTDYLYAPAETLLFTAPGVKTTARHQVGKDSNADGPFRFPLGRKGGDGMSGGSRTGPSVWCIQRTEDLGTGELALTTESLYFAASGTPRRLPLAFCLKVGASRYKMKAVFQLRRAITFTFEFDTYEEAALAADVIRTAGRPETDGPAPMGGKEEKEKRREDKAASGDGRRAGPP